MRAVAQRCSEARVDVVAGTAGMGRLVGACPKGLLVYLGVGREDGPEDASYLAEKVANLRVFMDADEKMNLSLLDLGLGALVVSQFTLYADARKGRRPSYSAAASGEEARRLYEFFCERLQSLGVHVERGEFGAIMSVRYINEGPITILLDSKKLF